jgi:hypothetical protein
MDTAATVSTAVTVTPAARRGCTIRGIGWAFRTRDITPERTLPIPVIAVMPVTPTTRVDPQTPAATVRPKHIADSLIGRRMGTPEVLSRITPHAITQRLRLTTPATRRAALDPPATDGPRRLRTRVLPLVTTPRQNRQATRGAETRADMAIPAVVDTRTAAAPIKSRRARATRGANTRVCRVRTPANASCLADGLLVCYRGISGSWWNQ